MAPKELVRNGFASLAKTTDSAVGVSMVFMLHDVGVGSVAHVCVHVLSCVLRYLLMCCRQWHRSRGGEGVGGCAESKHELAHA